MSAVETERVLVVPTEVFRNLGYFQGFSTEAVQYLDDLLRPENTSYRARGEMEENPDFKQLIPYVVFRHVDSAGQETIFQYTRGAGLGEQRLHAKVSIGIGGHISAVDADAIGSNPYEEGMRRELAEEVIIETDFDPRRVGLINDDETDVGRVHLGVVHIFDVHTPAVFPREQEMLEAGFRPVEELRKLRDHMESWSSICFDALFPGN